VGEWLVVDDPLRRADAIVILGGGGRGRVEEAARLFHSDYASWVVVTNTEMDYPGIRADQATLNRREALWQGIPEKSILVAPGFATTTYEEALSVKQLAEARYWRRLIIVTDPFHTRRAHLIYSKILKDTDIDIIMRPVTQHWYHPDTWWQTASGLRETWTEFLKLLLHEIGYQ